MLTVLTLLIRRKNPVIADFTEEKRNRQDAKKVLHFAFNQNILSRQTARKHFLRCFVICELGVISVLVNTIPDT